MRGLLLDRAEDIQAWVFETYQRRLMKYDLVIGVLDDESKNLVGAMMFYGFNGSNVNLDYYGENSLTPGIVRTICYIVIYDFNASRLTVVTSQKNKRLIRSLKHIGFRIESYKKYYYGPTDTRKHVGVELVAYKDAICRVGRIEG